jgi:UPF0755 protein
MKFRISGTRFFIAAFLAFAILYSIRFITTPISPGKPVQVDIAPGQSAWKISKTLEKNRIITDAFMFFATSRIMGKATHLQAGGYVFEGNHYPLDVINILFKGRTLRYRITLPEGSNIYQIGEIISSTGLITKDQFVQCALSKQIKSFFKVTAPSMEGYLYPDTYFLAPHMTPIEIMAKLFDRFNRMYTADMDRRAKKLGLTKQDVLTLASLIEKEAISAADKPFISSVFHNRLAIGMRLQSDPTAIYGIDGFKGKISPDDLMRESPYNTYRHKGLPPGPICSPSADSIEAALHPAKTDYLYFVSRGDGTHTFSSSLTEHNRAVSENARQRKKQQTL